MALTKVSTTKCRVARDSWENVCMEQRKGGLGVRSLSLFNRALLGKAELTLCIKKRSPMEIGHKLKIWGGRRVVVVL